MFVCVYIFLLIMSSNLSLLPYQYKVSTLTIPGFPGAYIYNSGIDNGTPTPVPIYMSQPVVTDYFMFDNDYMLLVLPGFKVSVYADVGFGTLKYTVDNTTGTDLMFYVNKSGSYTMSSYKLFYSFPTIGPQELTMNMTYSNDTSLVTSGNAVVSGPVTYNNISYTLFSYTTVGTSTFTYTGPTDISVEVLVVAGGGAGGGTSDSVQEAPGGAGAGGVAIGKIHISKGVSYTCSVGNGGQSYRSSGDNSYIYRSTDMSLTVFGGGGGASQANNDNVGGGTGGSGGGSTAAWAKQNNIGSKKDGSSSLPGSSITYYGNGGGRAKGGQSTDAGGGGGGGAGAVGGESSAGTPGVGGVGKQWDINQNYYGGGGAGGQGDGSESAGGNGGGGRSAVSGSANTGGGGGGQRRASPNGTFGKGGSGIIIIAVNTMYTYKVTLP